MAIVTAFLIVYAFIGFLCLLLGMATAWIPVVVKTLVGVSHSRMIAKLCIFASLWLPLNYGREFYTYNPIDEPSCIFCPSPSFEVATNLAFAFLFFIGATVMSVRFLLRNPSAYH
jgi:hypothetical protein